jgi:hypothetical protein
MMKNKMKKILTLLVAVACLVSTGIRPVMADDGGTKRVTFVNAKNESPDLFITKHVQNASDQYPAPEDAEFTFTLKLDGKLAKEKTYLLYDADGEKVANYKNGVEVPWTTDRSGTFTLKAEQTAKFEYVGTGVSYEVTEISVPDNFTQTSPASGSPVAGVILPTGSVAEFTNLYLESDTSSEGAKTKLVVQKSVSFPSGYQSPETPDFTFQVELDGKAYARQEYTITDTTTCLETGTDTTDAKGQFTLQGGYSATFEDVDANLDYQVKEILTDDEGNTLEGLEGWRCTGDTIQEGATQSPMTMAIFNNALASFVVTKQMEDGSKPETDFTFLLKDGKGAAMANATYLLYATTGEPVDEETHTTDEKGQFVLQPGQAAIFTGIPAGTAYQVSEVTQPTYSQVVPSSAAGYTDKTVLDSVEVLPFINKELTTVGLHVTKLVECKDSNVSPTEDIQFQFKLTSLADDGKTETPVADAVYSIEEGTKTSTYKTDENGIFKLKANQTGHFLNLDNGTYQVEEVNLDKMYTLKEGEDAKREITLAGESVYLTYTNVYERKDLDLVLTKKNWSGDVLAGAQFILYEDKDLTKPVTETLTTGEDGKITITDLSIGTYYLKEVKSPTGYQLLANPVNITIAQGDSGLTASVNGNNAPAKTSEEKQICISKSTQGNDQIEITIYNSKGFTLPASGGMGIALLLILAGLAGAVVILKKTYRRRA